MGMTALKIKLMPESPDTDLKEIKKKIEIKAEELKAKVNSIEEEPIAFGLKALIVTLAWPEEKDTDFAENALSEIEGVSSAQIIDYRRAFG